MPNRQYHLQIGDGDVGEYVLLPGDPGRCSLIAARLDDARPVAANREFTTWTGTLHGTPVSVTSTGIGGPSAAIAVEELSRLGAHTLLRVGTCGSMQAHVHKGDLVVATAAVRDEGTSRQYLPLPYPAVAAPEIVRSMCDALRAGSTPYHVGVVHSKDSFYGETQPATMPVEHELLEQWRAWERGGVLATEMECAAIFIVAAARRLRAGAILLCVNEPPYGMTSSALDSIPLVDLIDAAIAGVGMLIAAEGASRSARP
jgi:uridine phosphorylase